MRWNINVFAVRQIFLGLAVWLISFTSGLTILFQSPLNPSVLGTNLDINVTPDQASWIVTCLSLGGIVGCAFIAVVFETFGRKTANIITNLFILIGSLMLCYSYDVYAVAFARLTQGLSIGGSFISAITLCECICPKRRGCFMVLNNIFLCLGSLTSYYLSLMLDVKQMALIGVGGNVVSIIILTFSAESPLYSATQGQYEECAESFQWYRGESSYAKIELKELVSAQTEISLTKEREENVSVFIKITQRLLAKEFLKPFCIVMLAMLCLNFCGRYFLQTCHTQTLIELTDIRILSTDMSFITDFISIFALAVATVLVTYFKRRALLFNLGFISVFLMFMVSISTILESRLSTLQGAKWLTPTVILLHNFVTNIGLVPIILILPGEIFSSAHKGLGSFTTGLMFIIFFNPLMKLTPLVFQNFGVEETYLIYGVSLLFSLVLLRKILPETKGKALQQIEDEIKGLKKNNTETELINCTKVKHTYHYIECH